MSNSRSMSIVLADLARAVEDLRATVTELTDQTHAALNAPRTVTIDDLCTASGLGPDTVKKYIQKRQLPGRQIGDRYVIPDLEFDAFRRGEWQPQHDVIEPVRNFRHQVPKAG